MADRFKCLFSIAALAVCLQAQTPEFDAASIKPSATAGGRKSLSSDPGRITYSSVTLRDCLMAAYDVKDYQISGPDWMGTDRYDIVATAGGAISDESMKLMLQKLLMARFQMTVHREQKELPVYAMVVAKNGTKLHETENPGRSSLRMNGGGVVFSSVTIQQIIDYMSRFPTAELDRPVIDETGLRGHYDATVNLFGTQDEMMAAVSKGDLGSSIFTLLQEQLGLKLEPKKLPLDMVVVDKAEKVPTEN
jgi:uncharacterized protein (TIGR03435 family)